MSRLEWCVMALLAIAGADYLVRLVHRVVLDIATYELVEHVRNIPPIQLPDEWLAYLLALISFLL